MDAVTIQAILVGLGYDLGKTGPMGNGVDGAFGAKSRNALKQFQARRGLAETGVVNSSTETALREAARGPVSTKPVDPPWHAELLRRKGLHEVRNRTTLMAWLRSDGGKTLGDPAKLPWCGDAIATCLALTLPDEPQPVNPYLARNWMKFGKAMTTPAVGAVLVFWRGARNGTSGHVGLYVGEDAGALHVLGGNQSNAITIARLDRTRLLGMRWPTSYPSPTSGRVWLTSAGTPLSKNEA